MSVPISIETVILDGTPQSVVPLIYRIDSKCIEPNNISSSYAIIPGYASADCYEDVSQVGTFLDPRSTSIEAFVTDIPRITGKFEPTVIFADVIATTPLDYSEAQSLAEASAPFVDPDGPTTQGTARVTQSITVQVEDGYSSYVFVSTLDAVYLTATTVGTGNTEKSAEPLRFTSNVDKYYGPDEIAFDERLEDVYATAIVTGIYTKEPLKPKVIEAYSGQSPDDGSLSKVGNSQGFYWG